MFLIIILTSFSREDLCSNAEDFQGFNNVQKQWGIVMITKGHVDIILGLGFGDEGKGKIVNYIAPNYEITARFNGSSNAGHTIEYNCGLISLHTIPSGICRPGVLSIIGNGVAIAPYDFLKEREELKDAGVRVDPGSLRISNNAAITMPHHQILDSLEDLIRHLGTTGKGVGPVFASKIARDAIHAKELLDVDTLDKFYKEHGGMINNQIEYLLSMQLSNCQEEEQRQKCVEKLSKNEYFTMGKGLNVDAIIGLYHPAGLELQPYLDDTVLLLKSALIQGKNVLAEGAQAARLDIEHGTYPYVTSSNCGTAGAINGLGIPHTSIRDVIGVAKLVESRVGEGPFDTEIISYHQIMEMWKKGIVTKIFSKDMSKSETEAAQVYMNNILTKINHGKPQAFELYTYFANLLPGEYGATTGRPRAVGWLNLPAIEHYSYLNGVNKLALTKLDSYVGVKEFKVCVEYSDGNMNGKPLYKKMGGFSEVRNARTIEELPVNATKFIDLIEHKTKVPVSIISVGPMDDETIHLK
jgi:adenylosuccinate synthase